VSPGELDLAGNPRLAGPAPDIGAYELQPPAPPPPPPPADLAPALTNVSITNKVFAPAAARAARRRPKVKRGTTFRYDLSEAATVTIAIERQARGRKVGKRCACKRWVRAGVLKAQEQAGRQSTFFSGRFGKRALAPGRYRARLRATDATGHRSVERRVTFRVVRAPH
jgi:hypothetical protein